jgi:hypothetical protein
MKNTKILNIGVAVVMLLGLILWIRTGMNGEDLKGNADLQVSVLDPFYYLTLLLLVISAGAAVVFSVINLVKHPTLLKRSLIGLGAMVVILFVSYLISTGNVVLNHSGKELASADVSKWVSTGIWYSILLGGIGLLFFVVDFIKSFIK